MEKIPNNMSQEVTGKIEKVKVDTIKFIKEKEAEIAVEIYHEGFGIAADGLSEEELDEAAAESLNEGRIELEKILDKSEFAGDVLAIYDDFAADRIDAKEAGVKIAALGN